jgi:hypothetical protein
LLVPKELKQLSHRFHTNIGHYSYMRKAPQFRELSGNIRKVRK